MHTSCNIFAFFHFKQFSAEGATLWCGIVFKKQIHHMVPLMVCVFKAAESPLLRAVDILSEMEIHHRLSSTNTLSSCISTSGLRCPWLSSVPIGFERLPMFTYKWISGNAAANANLLWLLAFAPRWNKVEYAIVVSPQVSCMLKLLADVFLKMRTSIFLT